MAIPALVNRTDWVYLIGNLMIVAVAPPIIRYYLPFYRRLKVTSAYEYLEMRFGIAARLLASATFMIYQLGRMGVVVYLPSLALSAVTGWNIYLSLDVNKVNVVVDHLVRVRVPPGAGEVDESGIGTGGNAVKAGRHLEARLLVRHLRIARQDGFGNECFATVARLKPGDFALLWVFPSPAIR